MPTWENVEVSALMRLNTNSNSAYSASGLIARANDVTSPSATEASFYMYRLVRDERGNSATAQLYRKNENGGFSLLDSIGLGSLGAVPESENIFMKLITSTVGSDVHLMGMASLDQDFDNPFGMIDFTDVSANALLGPGSAGFRVFGTGPVNFDNFTVNVFHPAVPEPATLSLLALAGAGLLRRRRGRASH
jgi:hypothetical protein